MPMFRNPNFESLEAVVRRLGPLVGELVFLGGWVTGLLLSGPAAPPLRIRYYLVSKVPRHKLLVDTLSR
jgi:hypothetical protein